jgi:hypothetical protein
MVKRLQQVRSGEPLFEYIPAGKFSVLAYTRMTPPGNVSPEPDLLPAWYQKVESYRIARIESANRWSSWVQAQGNKALKWEYDLAQRLTMTVPREADLVREQAQQIENIRLGHENANKVYTFNETIGESVPTEKGIPLASPATGTLYSLWVQPRMQIFGAPTPALPVPTPGAQPMIALHAGGSSPVGEIIPPGTPHEVLALIPVPPRSLHWQERWQASLTRDGQSTSLPPESTKVEIGRVSINPTDARLIMPELSASEESVFVRVSLPANDPGKIGSVVRLKLISPPRPRAWFWLRDIWDNNRR